MTDTDRSRLPLIRSVDEYPYELSEEEGAALQQALARMEAYAVKAVSDLNIDMPEIRLPNSWAGTLNNPFVGLHLIDLGGYIFNDMAWCQRIPVRELAILLLNKKFHNEYVYRAHALNAKTLGMDEDKIASLDFFEESEVYDDEERVVLRFTAAACDGKVPDELFEEARTLYGDKELFQFIIAIAWWSFHAVLLNCTRPVADLHP